MINREMFSKFTGNRVFAGTLMAILALLCLCPGAASAGDSVCAEVQIEIRQELTLERQAFEAHMGISKGSSGVELSDVEVAISITDELGETVSIYYPYRNVGSSGAVFFIADPDLEHVDVDADTQDWTIGGSASRADLYWLIIPSVGASNGDPLGTIYYVGATLTYTIAGEEHVTEVSPDYIYVKPMPEFKLDYFIPREVYGQDAPEGLEPFSLGLRLINFGYGYARDMKIESAQPKITANEQGLKVAFRIEGCEVNGEPAPGDLLAEFGDMEPGGIASVRWVMTSTVSGIFDEFTAKLKHADELGGETTSLIDPDDVNTHYLEHDVLVDVRGRDDIRDFLARSDDGTVYWMYETENDLVSDVDYYGADSSEITFIDEGDDTYELFIEESGDPSIPQNLPAGGYVYIKQHDPYNGQKTITAVMRGDGKSIKAENAWIGKTKVGQTWNYYVSLFDANIDEHIPALYTVSFGDPPGVNHPPVIISIEGNTVAAADTEVVLTITVSDADGDTVDLTTNEQLAGALLVDNQDGTWTYSWIALEGEYELLFVADDGIDETTRLVNITICGPGDTDCDGLDDTWETTWFGEQPNPACPDDPLCLTGDDDPDNDLLSNAFEFRYGTIPIEANYALEEAIITAPAVDAEVDTLTPVLAVENIADAGSDATSYLFEIYADEEMTELVGYAAVPEGTDTTGWTVDVDLLTDNTWYFWRVRAEYGPIPSLWSYGSFFVNAGGTNDAPTPCSVSFPADGGTVDTPMPTLEATNGSDPEGKALTYTFAVFADDRTTAIVTSDPIGEGISGYTGWTVPDTYLTDGSTYYWQVTVTDPQGGSFETVLSSFTVDSANAACSAPVISVPANTSEVALADPFALAVDNAVDPDSSDPTYYFELDMVKTFAGADKQTSGAVAEGLGTTTWSVSGLADNTTYYWRVKATDGTAESSWTYGSFFVNNDEEGPAAPTAKNPGDTVWVESSTPTLEILSAVDPEKDVIASYNFKIYRDVALTDLAAEKTGSADPQWTIAAGTLEDITWYYWTGQAVDDGGFAGAWSDGKVFFVKDDGVNDPPEITLLRPAEKMATNLVNGGVSAIIQWDDTDPDSNASITLSYDPDADGPEPGAGAITIAPLEEDPDGDSDVYVWDLSGVADGSYYIAATIDDGTTAVTVYSDVTVTVDRTEPVVTVDPVGGSYPSGSTVDVTVTVADPTVGTVYYTVDGTEPDPDDTTGSTRIYIDGIPITITEDTLLKYLVIDEAGNETAGEEHYLFTNGPVFTFLQPAAPVVTIAGPVTIAWDAVDENGDATINLFYDSDNTGADGSPITDQTFIEGVDTSYEWDATGVPAGTYYLYAVMADGVNDDLIVYTGVTVTIEAATLTVSADPTGSDGPFFGPIAVTLSSDDPTATIYYTLDGSEPTTASTVYTAPVEISADTTVKFIAVNGGGDQSAAVTETYAFQMDITVTVETDKGRKLAATKVYVFTAAGVYTGKNATTDQNGMVRFNPTDFTSGSYKYRADYLTSQFWSEVATLPSMPATVMVIAEEPVEVTVTSASATVPGVKVYLFTSGGAYLSQNATTDTQGQVGFVLPVGKMYKFRADILSKQYWSDILTVSGGGTNSTVVDAGGGLFTVTLQEAPGVPMAGMGIYLFTGSGTYLNANKLTDAEGMTGFAVSAGDYKVRITYRGYEFWSDVVSVSTDTNYALTIPHEDVDVTVSTVFDSTVVPLVGVPVFLYTEGNTYQSINKPTNEFGIVTFHLPEKAYKVRADYLSRQYWSESFTGQNTSIQVPTADAEITVTGAGLPQAGVPVYVYNGSGTYLNITASTDNDGKRTFQLPEGTYRFRADYQANQYWSPDVTLTAHELNPIVISAGGGAFTVSVIDDTSMPLAGLPCYVFDGSGTYLGLFGATNGNGEVSFDLADGTYQIRVDYLGAHFWSNAATVPGSTAVTVTIPHETMEVTVTTASKIWENVRVYLFSETDVYLGRYETTDATGSVSFDLPVGQHYRLRADILGSRHWSETITVSAGGVNTVSLDAGGGIYQVTVLEDATTPMEEIPVYLFNDSGTYLGLTQTTDSEGVVAFDVPEGIYQVRANYMGFEFWNGPSEVREDTAVDYFISHQDVTITVNRTFLGSSESMEGIPVLLHTATGSYQGISEQTNSAGQAIFHLPERPYSVRADYLSRQYWSEPFTWQNRTVAIPTADAEVTVTGAGLPQEGMTVFVYTASGNYLNLGGLTNGEGKVVFRLPEGQYLFQTDYQGSRFWSGETGLSADQVHPVLLSVGGGMFTVSVVADESNPLSGVPCYVYDDGGSYLNLSRATDADGTLTVDLSEGSYRVRIDYLGYQFWSDLFIVPDTMDYTITIPHQDVTITVEGTLAGDMATYSGIPVYLFTPAGAYMGRQITTDQAGQAVFSLPERAYNVRADYLNRQYWSGEFAGFDTTIAISEGAAQVQVVCDGEIVAGVPVFVFSSEGTYLGLHGATDGGGTILFRLPSDTYRFRTDYYGNRYWATATIAADVVNDVVIDSGGGSFVLTLETGSGPLADTRVYLFNGEESYLDLYHESDENGRVRFDLSDGTYRFRIDHDGYQFRTGDYEIPATLAESFLIPHQDAVITVEKVYQETTPLSGLNTFLFTSAGAYLGKSESTAANGSVSFFLPDRDYAVRADYLGEQFWSADFRSADTTITINHGAVQIHAQRAGAGVAGATVYLYNEQESYLGRFETTDETGTAEFVLPDRVFKFRVNEGDDQVWSPAVSIIAGEVTSVEVGLE